MEKEVLTGVSKKQAVETQSIQPEMKHAKQGRRRPQVFLTQAEHSQRTALESAIPFSDDKPGRLIHVLSPVLPGPDIPNLLRAAKAPTHGPFLMPLLQGKRCLCPVSPLRPQRPLSPLALSRTITERYCSVALLNSRCTQPTTSAGCCFRGRTPGSHPTVLWPSSHTRKPLA